MRTLDTLITEGLAVEIDKAIELIDYATPPLATLNLRSSTHVISLATRAHLLTDEQLTEFIAGATRRAIAAQGVTRESLRYRRAMHTALAVMLDTQAEGARSIDTIDTLAA